MATNNVKSQAAKNGKKVTLKKNEGEKVLKPYCERAKEANEYKRKVDEVRPAASEYLKEKLNNNPETKDFTGTVVCIFNEQVYQIRVQRPDNTDWTKKNLKDPNLKEYKAVMAEIQSKKERAAELEAELANAHPKCVDKGFVIGFMNK